MTRLLECQKKALEKEKDESSETLRLYSIALICFLLDMFESDLTAEELADIEHFAHEWSNK